MLQEAVGAGRISRLKEKTKENETDYFMKTRTLRTSTAKQNLSLIICLVVAAGTLVPVAASPFLPVEERKRNFAGRDNPEQAAAAAADFLDLLTFEVPTRGFENPRAPLAEIAKLRDEGQPVEALGVFHSYFLGKLRNPQQFGLTAWDVSPSSRGIAGRWNYPGRGIPSDPDVASADRLLEGFWGEVEIGPPGQVNWLYPHKSWDDLKPGEPGGLPAPELLLGTAFDALPAAYLATGDEKYLRAWAAYMDDWAINSAVTTVYPHPGLVPLDLRGSTELINFIRILGGLSQAIPYDRQAELLPPATLARVLGKYWEELSLLQALYLRTNTHNWTPGGAYLLLGLLLDEFKAAPLLFREGRRRKIEDNAVTQNLRDGSENQQDPWYNDNYVFGTGQVAPLFEARQRVPGWQELPWVEDLKNDPEWFQEIREHQFDRIGFQLRLRTPQGSWPVGVRGRDKRPGGTDAFHISPEAFADPELRRIRLAMADATRPANQQTIHAASSVKPSYHSEWFPYGGFNLVREGWEADSGYGHMFTSPAPGSYGGRRSRSNNNFFGLAAFGQDLIVEEKWSPYALMDSPIKVDGLPQDFLTGTARVPSIARHKMTPTVAWTEPGYWRWHASDHFNLMEGIYEGPYAKTDSLNLRAPEAPVSMQVGGGRFEDALLGIRHQRWVQFVRDARLWIVTDRMRGSGEHTYTQYWYLPLKPGGDHAFTEAEIEVSPVDRRVRTKSESATKVGGVDVPQANVSLYSFSAEPLNYKTAAQPRKTDREHFGQYRIELEWQGSGDSLVVTVIYPRAPGAGIEADIVPRQLNGPGGALGFETELPGGGTIQYLAAPGDTALALELGGVRAEAESLLVTANGGIVMGGLSFSIDGLSQPVAHPDFEFTRTPASGSAELVITPIYRPIAPVEIGPAQNVFVDQIEVTMSSKTPEVEIRYTVDGSEPTPQSTLYEGPFVLDHTAIVKARAYRPGVTGNPPHTSGTHATATSRAVFDKELPIKAVAAKNPQPGLQARYFEDDWRTLWLRLDSLEPKGEASGVDTFDLSVVPATNPPLGDTAAPRKEFFAVEYTGFLDVPETGVYTLHAPREYVMPDIDPGYELRIFLGQNIVPFGGRTQVAGLKEWYPSTRLHAQGNWSVALEKGLQPIRIVYLDYRTDGPARLNHKGLAEYIWSGVTPDLKISGPDLEPQPIPAAWLMH
jgi:hypothetical protein